MTAENYQITKPTGEEESNKGSKKKIEKKLTLNCES